MKVYIVETKRFFKNEVTNNEYQVANALQPISVYSSRKKANKVMEEYEKYYEEKGYTRNEKYNNLFPIEHFSMNRANGNSRVVIALIESEVE